MDPNGNCSPDDGFAGWVDGGIGRPLEAAQTQVEALHARIFCNAPTATKADLRCARAVAVAGNDAIRAVRSCYLACNQHRQRGELPTGTTCIAGDPDLDPATVTCIGAAVGQLSGAMACGPPSCIGGDLPRVIEAAGAFYNAALFCDESTPRPIDGVNVVAVDSVSGIPVIARLSGAAGVPGGFELVGLPPATYDVQFLGGDSFDGSYPGLFPPQVQTNNFDGFSSGPITVNIGSVHGLAKVAIPIADMSIDAIAVGSDRSVASPTGPGPIDLPAAIEASSYEIWLHMRGGVRPLQLVAAESVPAGLAATMVAPQGLVIAGQGEHWIHLLGTPLASGSFSIAFSLIDQQKTHAIASAALTVRAP